MQQRSGPKQAYQQPDATSFQNHAAEVKQIKRGLRRSQPQPASSTEETRVLYAEWPWEEQRLRGNNKQRKTNDREERTTRMEGGSAPRASIWWSVWKPARAVKPRLTSAPPAAGSCDAPESWDVRVRHAAAPAPDAASGYSCKSTDGLTLGFAKCAASYSGVYTYYTWI